MALLLSELTGVCNLLRDENNHRFRRDPIRDNLKSAEPKLLVGGDIEPDGIELVRDYRHRAGIVRAAVPNVSSLEIRDANQGKVSRGLNIVTVKSALR
jgi:hypothetical protein